MFGQIGMSELLVILVIVLLVFGPKKIPELARNISKGLNEFRRAAEDVKEELTLDHDRSTRTGGTRPAAPPQQKSSDTNAT
ncbi:MAG: Sec-independent protein translocase subunit TatA/TatB [bacterium]